MGDYITINTQKDSMPPIVSLKMAFAFAKADSLITRRPYTILRVYSVKEGGLNPIGCIKISGEFILTHKICDVKKICDKIKENKNPVFGKILKVIR